MDLYYVVEESGYWIFDRNNPNYKIHQFEPYIPDHNKNYEANAQIQIEQLMNASSPDPMSDPRYLAGYEQALLDMVEDMEE